MSDTAQLVDAIGALKDEVFELREQLTAAREQIALLTERTTLDATAHTEWPDEFHPDYTPPFLKRQAA